MFEAFKVRHTFVDDVNVITKIVVAILLFFFVIFVHQFDVIIYSTLFMFLFLVLFHGVKFKVFAAFIIFTFLFALISSLSMIFYGEGTHTWFKLGFLHITRESFVRGIHLTLRLITVSCLGILISLTSEIVMIFYSVMQHLKVKPKFAYAFMAAIRMVPIMLSSFIQLRHSLKMRYQVVDRQHYKGLKRLKHMFIPLLSQNIRRAHQLSVAMEKKGFQDGPRTYYYKAPFSYKDVLFVIIILLLIVLSCSLPHWLPITAIQDVRSHNW
ncbi:energy-coupling factor transporter transmembrane protein EcfT [Staphylococcus sp. SQ8-PEA]|uniref:Energy-coupling factor transporter transmembrane protein EcfT n=1 Tax=Staphylococcus marylandisciuri TaxID=2981529 RepID=A0ABT2QNR9_9STAP|nr:energy-coupling factor transporter transmembrane component T [Staphylococcus marylandisciuri]MCU5745624.1 energy-coupling factor transporter transmembrane protein EcfT [Staphylococcus marylandisciuri]